MTSPAPRAIALLLATGLLSACVVGGQRQHRPAAPLASEDPDTGTRLRVVEVTTDGQPTSFVVGTAVRARGALVAASLGSSSAPPCGGAGPVAAVLELDGQRRLERPLSLDGGERSLRLAFPAETLDGPRDMASGGFLDVQLVDPADGQSGGRVHCLRTPLAGAAVPAPGAGWRDQGAWSAGWNVWFYPAFQLGGSLGRWVGPVRFGTDLGVSTQSCEQCPRGAGYLLFPVSLTAESYLAMDEGPALGLKMAYDVVPGVAAAFHRRDALWLHGPRVELKLAIVHPDGGLGHGPRRLAFYLGGFLARWGRDNPFAGDGETVTGVSVGWDVGL